MYHRIMSIAEKTKFLYSNFEQDLIKSIEKVGHIRKFKADEMIMKTGQKIRHAILILEGGIRVFREDDEGNEIFMYNLHPGQACAISMTCAIRNLDSEIMAKTFSDTTVITIPIELMNDWPLKYPSWYQFVLETYRTRFEELLVMVDQIAFKNLDQRLMWYLHEQSKSFKTNKLKISYTAIAQEMNSSREVISRLMKKLQETGQIKVEKNEIEIIKFHF